MAKKIAGKDTAEKVLDDILNALNGSGCVHIGSGSAWHGRILDVLSRPQSPGESVEDRELDAPVAEPQTGPWRVADYTDKSAVGRNWEIADFGECAHHNKKVWVTTENVAASMTNGACPCEDAAFLVWARNNKKRIMSALKALGVEVPNGR